MIKSLYRPIDGAILIYFRIFAGILFAQELINQILTGKFDFFAESRFFFSYMYFDWLRPWSYWGMVTHYTLSIFAAYAVAFNYRYRFFSVVLLLGYTSLVLFDGTENINHQYLYSLMMLWMIVLPLDQGRKSYPAWMLYLLLFHLALVWFYGADSINLSMFQHSTFPWFCLLLMSLLLGPSWPRKVPVLRSFLPWGIERVPEFRVSKGLMTMLCAYVFIQLALPFTNWTKKVNDVRGSVLFFVQNNKNGFLTLVEPLDHIKQRQFDGLVGDPDKILQFSHYLRDHYKKIWNTDVSVFASGKLIAPGTDLAKEERSILPYKWVVPLHSTKSRHGFGPLALD